jgi:hypothetical protein
MFNRHLVKVILGFCGMILFGLISLVVIDSFKDKEPAQVIKVTPPVEPTPKPQSVKKPVKKITPPSTIIPRQ